MNRFAIFSAAILAVSSFTAAHATTIAPGVDLSNSTSDLAFTSVLPGTFVASDAFHTVTVVYASVPGIADTFAVTDVCATIGFGVACPSDTLTISDTNAAGLAVGVGLSAAAAADTTLSTQLATINLDGSLGLAAENIDFALPTGTGGGTSPVPEPGTLGLLASGALSAAGLLRRRLTA